jgi:hypothetical protein
VVLEEDALLWRGSAASTAAMSSMEKRRSRGDGKAAAELESRATQRQRQRRSERWAEEAVGMASSPPHSLCFAVEGKAEMGGVLYCMQCPREG